MRIRGFNRYAASSCVAAALLAGCGGSQPPIATPGAMPQSPAIATHAARGTSWWSPAANGEDLLYVAKHTNVVIYSYPSDKVIGKLTGFEYASGLCSDQRGDVWVTDSRKSQVSEYQYSGTKPIARLSDDDEPVGCAVDPRSGDLAVANYDDNVYIYRHGKGNPAIYTAPDFYDMQFCSYDGSGDLFVDGDRAFRSFVVPGILKLSYGGTELQRYNLERTRRDGLNNAGGIQWDGESLVVGYAGKHRNVLYRISDLGRIGKITKRIELTVPGVGYIDGGAPFLLHGGKIIAPYEAYPSQFHIALWPYPAGGAALKEFLVPFAAGLALSRPPK